ncbi:MAG: hypothetical protein JXQ27_05425 [Acidobacteria bacterium]|nr:hypothetical protein [Acidobacteriota bacterium]
MKKTWIVVCASTLVLAIALGLTGWAQDAHSSLFDTRRTGREVEIMKGILETTLQYALKDSRPEKNASTNAHYLRGAYFFAETRIGGYYLYGQGAVFTISGESLMDSFGDDHGPMFLTAGDELLFAEDLAGQEYVEAEEEMESDDEPSPATKEKMKERIAAAKERMKKKKEEAEKRKAEFQQALGSIKVQLVETLATHGDSLSQVGPDEYITLIITPVREVMPRPQIISVKRSVVTDFKTGRLTLDAFRGKVLQYTN